MPVTNLKAQHMVDPAACRELILGAMISTSGNASQAAHALGCSYHTLWRLICRDELLKQQVEELRCDLHDKGELHIRGWSPAE